MGLLTMHVFQGVMGHVTERRIDAQIKTQLSERASIMKTIMNEIFVARKRNNDVENSNSVTFSST